MKYERILILGDPGSGKNYVGERLAAKLGVTMQDMDDIYYIRKFDIERPKPARRRMLVRWAAKRKWLIVGVAYSWIQPAVSKAQLILILRESFWREAYRIFRRYGELRGLCP